MEDLSVRVSCADPDGVKDFFWEKLMEDLPMQIILDEHVTTTGPPPKVFIVLHNEQAKLDGCHLPVHWYKRPYLFLYLIDRSSNAIITKEEKKKMKKWAAEIQNRQEWLVIQFVAPEARRSMIPFYDKSKLDLPKDRYFQVQKKRESTEDWNEAVKRISECIGASFQRQIKEYKIEVKNHLNRQLVPGWNFCHYFVITEGLAFTMIQCGSLDIALGYYQMAKDVYNSLSDDKRIIPFFNWNDGENVLRGELVENVENWVSSQRRELIYQSQVSEFQFYEYIFARRFWLLMTLHRPLAALKEVLEFLQLMTHKIDQYSAQFPSTEQATIFKHLWAFSAGFSVLKHPVVKNFVISAPDQLTRENSKSYSFLGDILYYVRSRMDAILEFATEETYPSLCVSAVLHPEDSSEEEEQEEEHSRDLSKIQTPILAKALESRKMFDESYEYVSKMAQRFYKLSEYRPRSVTRLTFDMASLHFSQKRYKKAASYLRTISIEDGWHSIATHVRMQLAECEQYLQHSDVYVTACLGLLGPECDTEIRDHYQKQLVEVATSGLSNVLMRDLYPLIDCRLKLMSKRSYIVGDTLTVDCILDSNLLHPITFNKLSLTMSDSSSDSFMHASDTINFTLRTITVEPGKNVFQLSAELPSKATFQFDKIRLELGKLVLSQQLRSSYEPITVENSNPSLEIEIAQPDSPLVGQIQSIQLIFMANEDTIQRGVVTVQSSTGLQILDHTDGEIQITSKEGDIRKLPLSFTNARFILPACAVHESMELFIPVVAPIGTTTHELSITLAYEKHTKETFDIVALVEIPFEEGIKFTHRALASKDSQYVQIRARNTSKGVMQLVKHDLVAPSYVGSAKHVPNGGLQNTLLYPKCVMSFVYQLPLVEEPEECQEKDYHFSLYFAFLSDVDTASFLPDKFEIQHTFVISKPKVNYEISLSSPQKGIFGEPFPFSFAVVRKHSSVVENVTFCVEGNNQWLVIGKAQATIKLAVSSPELIHLQLVPIATGWLPLPDVLLKGIDKENLFYQPQSQKVKISPQGKFDCRCVPISLKK